MENKHIHDTDFRDASLRDVLAGFALAGLLARVGGTENADLLAREALAFADALIEALSEAK